MIVSTDCAHFEEVIRAYHRVLDLKNGKHIDLEVLDILVNAIKRNLNDNYGRPCKMFKKSAKELFGRLTAENNFESKLWELYAELMTSQENDENVTENDLFKAGQYMQKATATYMQSNKDWYKSSSSIKNGLELSSKYAETCLNVASITDNKNQSIQQMASAKLTIKSIISKVKQNEMEDSTKEVHETFQVAEINLNRLIQEIERLKA